MLVYAIICSKSKNTISCCAMWNITEAICCLNFVTPFSILSWLLMKKMIIIILHLFARLVQVSLLQNYFYLSLFLFFFVIVNANLFDCCPWTQVNAENVAVSGKKRKQKLYRRHSGRPGGMTIETFEQLQKRIPERIVEHAVRGMLPKGRVRHKVSSFITIPFLLFYLQKKLGKPFF